MNTGLREELLTMEATDRALLRELIEKGELADTPRHPRMQALHEQLTPRIKTIISEYGWPGIALVGKEGSRAAWLLTQHAVEDMAFMAQTLPLLRAAVAQGDAEGWCLAYLEDRVLTQSGQAQIYGTQHDFDDNGEACPLPIDDPDRVNERRHAVGLGPLAEATRQLQARYRPDSATGSR